MGWVKIVLRMYNREIILVACTQRNYIALWFLKASEKVRGGTAKHVYLQWDFCHAQLRAMRADYSCIQCVFEVLVLNTNRYYSWKNVDNLLIVLCR